ncbi:MAG: hypothetical protein ABL953_00295 [Ilumatobacteraceae bacterium]
MDDEHRGIEVDVLVAIGEVDAAFAELGRRLRSRTDVREVLRSFSVTPNPWIDFYTDAVLTNDDAVSWGLEAHLNEHEWIIESSIRRNHSRGQDLIQEFATRFAIGAEDFINELRGAARMLLAVWPQDTPMFDNQGYGG